MIYDYAFVKKPYPFDILLTEKRSACFVADAPFEVTVIHFCFDFRSRHISSASSGSFNRQARAEKNLFLCSPRYPGPVGGHPRTCKWTGLLRTAPGNSPGMYSAPYSGHCPEPYILFPLGKVALGDGDEPFFLQTEATFVLSEVVVLAEISCVCVI